MSAETTTDADALSAWAADGGARATFSPLTGRTHLLLDASADGLSKAKQKQIAGWLRQLPCPTIGIGTDDNAIAQACDALVASTAEAKPLLDGARKSPLAAAAFVQLLRNIEGLPLEAALMTESLTYSTLQAGPEYRAWLEQNRAPAPAQHKDAGPAVIARRDDDTLTLELNRASNRNAMSVEMRDALMEALQLALDDASIARVEISGRGKCFSTGGDLTEFGSAPDSTTAHLVRGLALPGRLLAQCADKTTVTVHGACVGSGIEFPAFAGRIVARADAWFQLPELGFGLIPGAGGCVSIARRIGRQRTAWLVLGGKRIDAQRACEWGLADELA